MIDQGVAIKGDGLSVGVRVNEAEMALTQVTDGLELSKMQRKFALKLVKKTTLALTSYSVRKTVYWLFATLWLQVTMRLLERKCTRHTKVCLRNTRFLARNLTS